MVGLESGEEEDVLVEGGGELLGDVLRDGEIVEGLGQNAAGFLDGGTRFWIGEPLGVVALLFVQPFNEALPDGGVVFGGGGV